MVLVKNPAKLRPYWYLGRVLELLKGDDNNVRSVKLRRSDGGIHTHSLKHLYPLELSLTHSHQAEGPLDKLVESDVVSSGRPSEQVEPVDSGHNLRPRRPMRSENDSEFLFYSSLAFFFCFVLSPFFCKRMKVKYLIGYLPFFFFFFDGRMLKIFLSRKNVWYF